MELSQLRYFVVTAQEEHFTRAAQILHITQPSLSRAIANLEEELGAPLFDREGKRVRLNPCGRAFLVRAEQILTLADEAAGEIRDMTRGMRGQVRVGASFPITAPSPVYFYQREFFHAHPGVTLILHVHSGGRIEELLESRDLDFGISLAPINRPGILSEPLYTDKMGIIVGPEHPLAGSEGISLSALAEERFLCNSTAPDPSDSARHLCGLAGFQPRIIYEGESAELIGQAVSMGRGISFVSEARYQAFQQREYVPQWERELRYVPLTDGFCTRTVYLHRRISGYYPQAAREFRKGLLFFLKEEEDQKRARC